MTIQALPLRLRPQELTLGKILVPSDFSPESTMAFNHALRLGQHFGAEVSVLHVLEPMMSSGPDAVPCPADFCAEELAAAEKNLHAWANAAGAAGVQAKLILRNGTPEHEIVEAAKDLNVDLIILAAHGETGWKHFCISSTAERVVRAAPCPVLVVREKEHQFC